MMQTLVLFIETLKFNQKNEPGQLCFCPGLPAITNKDSICLARWKNPALVYNPVSSFAFWLNGILSVTHISNSSLLEGIYEFEFSTNNWNSSRYYSWQTTRKKKIFVYSAVCGFSTHCELAWSAPYNGTSHFFPSFSHLLACPCCY